jgi:hypothetical protein
MPFWIVSEAGRKILKLEGAITVRSAQEFAAKLMWLLQSKRLDGRTLTPAFSNYCVRCARRSQLFALAIHPRHS